MIKVPHLFFQTPGLPSSKIENANTKTAISLTDLSSSRIMGTFALFKERQVAVPFQPST